METNIVKGQFKQGSEYKGREYSYYAGGFTFDVGDIAVVETKNGKGHIKICEIDIPESEVSDITQYMKEIIGKEDSE